MRYLIFGAGAVGGVIGARLHSAGSDVVLLARGANLDAIRTNGVTLVTPDGTQYLNVPTTDHVAGAGLTANDVVVLAVKSQDTAVALNLLRADAPSSISVVCAQNGVANERLALRVFANVYAMYAWLPAALEAPGVLLNHATPVAGALHLSRFPTGRDEVAKQISADLRRAGFASNVHDDVMRLKYRKLVSNLGNALDALTGEWFGAGLFDRARQEAEQCFVAAGIDVQTSEEEAALGNPGVSEIAGRPWAGSSSRQSLQRQTGSIETDYLNGEIVLLGRLTGIPTPVNSVLQRLSTRAARELWPPGALTVDEIEAELDDSIEQISSG